MGRAALAAADRTCSLVGGSPRLLMAIGWTRDENHALAVTARRRVNERPRIKLQLRREYLISAETQVVRSAGLVRVRRAVSSSTETALYFTGFVNDSGAALRLHCTRIALLNVGLHVIMTIDK
jgi:hypothetical protein